MNAWETAGAVSSPYFGGATMVKHSAGVHVLQHGAGPLRCLWPQERSLVNVPEMRRMWHTKRCGICENCLVVARYRERTKRARLMAAEMRAAEVTLWVTLTLRAVEGQDVHKLVKAFIRRLRLGRVRCRPLKVDALGRSYMTKRKALRFEGSRLPEVPVPRSAAKRELAGFIKGDPALRYSYVLERGEKRGRIHAHVLLHIKQAGSVPPGAIPEAWPHGWVAVRVCGTGEKDVVGLSRYLAKYVSKETGNVLRTSSKYGRGKS